MASMARPHSLLQAALRVDATNFVALILTLAAALLLGIANSIMFSAHPAIGTVAAERNAGPSSCVVGSHA